MKDDVNRIMAERDELRAEVAKLKADLDRIKTIDFPLKVDAVAKDNFVRGLVAGKEAAIMWPFYAGATTIEKAVAAIDTEIAKAKAGKL